MTRSVRITSFFLLALGVASCATQNSQEQIRAALPPLPSDSKPRPEFFNERYGPYERNVFDLWQAKSPKHAPVLLFLHGGGFVGGDKWTLDPNLLHQCLQAGISVASANYRYSTQAPFPAPMLDGARVVQFLRANAKKYHIDPKRIAVSGSSAGAGMSLWIAFHDDLADKKNSDKVLRMSTRVSCAGVWGAQSSYDPRFIKEVIGGRAYEHAALPMFYGIQLTEIDTPKAHKLYEEASAINYATKDDPPVMMFYGEPNVPLKPGPNTGPNLYYPDFGKPLAGYDNPGTGIHHPKFGFVLKEKLDSLGVGCTVRLNEDYAGKGDPNVAGNTEFVAFLKHQFHIR